MLEAASNQLLRLHGHGKHAIRSWNAIGREQQQWELPLEVLESMAPKAGLRPALRREMPVKWHQLFDLAQRLKVRYPLGAQIVELTARGYSVPEQAGLVGISEDTVRRIFQKVAVIRRSRRTVWIEGLWAAYCSQCRPNSRTGGSGESLSDPCSLCRAAMEAGGRDGG